MELNTILSAILYTEFSKVNDKIIHLQNVACREFIMYVLQAVVSSTLH